MGLFDRFKKDACTICGKEIGAIAKRKVADGYICSECDDKLSPYYTGRKQATTDEVRRQLEYREANKAEVESFQVTRTLGREDKVMIDDDKGVFVVTSRGGNWRDYNPDVIPLEQVTGAEVDVDEDRSEETYTDNDGNTKRYNPPRYNYSYRAKVNLSINSPWFSQITVDIDSGDIPHPNSSEVQAAREVGNNIREALTKASERRYEEREAARAPKAAVTCPHCGATTFPDASGRCEYCGGAMGL